MQDAVHQGVALQTGHFSKDLKLEAAGMKDSQQISLAAELQRAFQDCLLSKI